MDKHIEELKELALKSLGDKRTVTVIGADLFHVSTLDGDGIADCDNQQQAEFIASASPTMILALLAKLEAAEARLLVPVKLPSERFQYHESDYDDGHTAGWNSYRLEAIKEVTAAGYPVKGGE